MLAESVKKNLTECILPFWMKLKDEDNGGFYGVVDPELSVHKDADPDKQDTLVLLRSLSYAWRYEIS